MSPRHMSVGLCLLCIISVPIWVLGCSPQATSGIVEGRSLGSRFAIGVRSTGTSQHEPAPAVFVRDAPRRESLKHHMTCHVYVVTDPHMDTDYSPRSANKCLQGRWGLRCCRPYNIALRGSLPAPIWGSASCDSPPLLIERALQASVDLWKSHPPCAIVLLGDAANHHDTSQSYEGNINVLDTLLRVVARTYVGVAVIPVLGNHDSWFVDQARPPGRFLSRVPFYRTLVTSTTWGSVIPRAQHATFAKGGYYFIRPCDVGLANIGFVVLNTIWASNNNLFLREEDPAEMGKWLIALLSSIRQQREFRVVVLMHSPVDDMTPSWRGRMTRIMYEFRDVIASVWCGHTHTDRFSLLPITPISPMNPPKAGSHLPPVVFTIPSIVPDDHQPALRVMSLRAIDGGLVDFTQYGMPLPRDDSVATTTPPAHGRPTPEVTPPSWFVLYTASTTYWNDTFVAGRDLLTPWWWYTLYSRMKHDNDLAAIYMRHYNVQPNTAIPRFDTYIINSVLVQA